MSSNIEATKIYTTEELSAVLGISKVTARSYCRKGIIPSKKIGKGWKVLGQHVMDYLESSSVPPQPQTIIPVE